MSEDRSHFTMIPHLIDDLGLDVYQYRVYGAIKRATGEDGVCTKSCLTISKECRISERKVITTIQELCEINPIVKKPLISKKNRLTEHGDKDTNIVVVNDIWKENSYKFKKQSGGACGAPPPARHAPGGAQETGGVVHVVHQGGAHGAYKEEPFKKNPIKKTPPPSPPEKAKEEEDDFKIIEKIVEDSVRLGWPFTRAGIFDVFKRTSGFALYETLQKYKKRKKGSAELRYPDLWLLSEAQKEHNYQTRKNQGNT